jgi:transcription elongation GreA/GreB family factor
MRKVVKIAEKPGGNTEVKFGMRVKIGEETSETERAVVKQIVNFAMKDATPDAITAATPDAASIAVIP